MMQYLIKNDLLTLEYVPETTALSVKVSGTDIVWSWNSIPEIRLSDGGTLSFADAVCESQELKTDVKDGVRAVYRDFRGADGTIYPYIVETFVALDITSGDLLAEVRVNGDEPGAISGLVYPPRMKFDAAVGEGYTVLPRMQGTLVPAGQTVQLIEGNIYDGDATIPIFGQIKNSCGYTAIYDTPFDAKYELAGEEVQPYFIPSLGTLSYKRVMRYAFFAQGDFNTMAKKYRSYLAERGQLVTLREKMVRNPRVKELIGTPIVHSGIAVHISPQSYFYNPDKPEINDHFVSFAERAEQLRQLKANGAEKIYLHLDGWGNHGYDNLHPDPFPIHEESGGADGMRDLQKTCKELGYLFGIHDQYRDYYYDAPSFSLDNAIQNLDGSHPYCSIWYGGAHSFLCAKLAPDYVRRNYNEFERLNIHLDGSYLDVFSVVFMDECFNPDHKMTREECAAARRECLDVLTDRGIIPSSEEVLGCIVNSQVLCHYVPFFISENDSSDADNSIGINIPLLNLVYHDCVVIPWFGLRNKGEGNIPNTERGFLWALLCGDTIYYEINESVENIAYGKIALELNRRVALCDMTSHTFIDGSPRKRRSVFSDGTTVEVDFDADTFEIRYPDGVVVSG